MAARPLLVVFAGLPGTGKSTMARRLAREVRCTYLRVDAVETALTRLGRNVHEDGYAVVHELAVSNLSLGLDVVVDAVNSTPEARGGWQRAAQRGNGELTFIETVIADPVEHRARVEGRQADIPGHVMPTWKDVQAIEWFEWDEVRDGPRLRVDTSDTDAAAATIRQAG